MRPFGRPDVLYFTPEISHHEILNYKFEFNDLDFIVAIEECCEYRNNHGYICSREFSELARFLMTQAGFEQPTSAGAGKDLFCRIIQNL